MRGKRRRHAARSKAKVALQALRGELTAAQEMAKAAEAEVEKLHARIGQGWWTGSSGQGLRSMGLERRRQMIEPGGPQVSLVRQGEMLSISRSGLPPACRGVEACLEPAAPCADAAGQAQFLEAPWCGSRLMAKMSLAPIYSRRRTSTPHHEQRILP
jgi:hypothetical protein